MSDTTDVPEPSEQTPEGDAAPGGAEVEVDVAAFLPEGVTLGADDADDAHAEPGARAEAGPAADAAPPVDVAAIDRLERDLDGVDAAIAALDAGTYGIDPATGLPRPDEALAQDPTGLS